MTQGVQGEITITIAGNESKAELLVMVNHFRHLMTNYWVHINFRFNVTDYNLKIYKSRLVIRRLEEGIFKVSDNNNHLGTDEQFDEYFNDKIQ